MNKVLKKFLFAGAVIVALVGTTAVACDTPQSKASDKINEARLNKLNNLVVCGEPNDSNTCKNLAEHVKRNEDPSRLTYIYLLNMMGEPYAYFVAKGPVTPTSAQMAPMDMVIDVCPGTDRCWELAEAPGDDGSSGPGVNGLFFYDVNHNEVELYNISAMFSDGPLDIPGVKEFKTK